MIEPDRISVADRADSIRRDAEPTSLARAGRPSTAVGRRLGASTHGAGPRHDRAGAAARRRPVSWPARTRRADIVGRGSSAARQLAEVGTALGLHRRGRGRRSARRPAPTLGGDLLLPGDDPVLPRGVHASSRRRWRGEPAVAARGVAGAERADDRVVGLRGFFRDHRPRIPGHASAELVEVDPAAAAEGADRRAAGRRPAPGDRAQDEAPRTRRHARRTELGLARHDGGAGPAGDGAAEAAGHRAGPRLGGAARRRRPGASRPSSPTTLAAAATGCRIELVGRTPLPAEPRTRRRRRRRTSGAAGGVDRRRGERSPAEIERRSADPRRPRGAARPWPSCARWAARSRYHSSTCATHEARAPHGQGDPRRARPHRRRRLRGRRDRGQADRRQGRRSRSARVFDTKVDGARALLAAVDGPADAPAVRGAVRQHRGGARQPRPVRLRRRQRRAARRWARLWPAKTGTRALTVHWGPWAPDRRHGGMVTPELMRTTPAAASS